MRIKLTFFINLTIIFLIALSSGCTVQQVDISEEGSPALPWLLTIRDSQLYLSEIDLENTSHLASFGFTANLSLIPSSDNSRLAIINGANPILSLFQLPGGNSVGSFSLVASPDISSAEQNTFAGEFSSSPNRLAQWSPQQPNLAFISVRDGTDSQVYLYGASTNTLTQMTNVQGNVQKFYWSMDGRFLAFEFTGEGIDASFTFCGLIDTTHFQAIEITTTHHDVCHIIGWSQDGDLYFQTGTDEQTLIIERYSLSSDSSAQIWEGTADAISLDPASETLSIALNSPDRQSSVLLIHDDTSETLLDSDPTFSMEWNAIANLFFAETQNGWELISPNNTITIISGEHGTPVLNGSLPTFISNGGATGVAGMRIYDLSGSLLHEVLDLPVSSAQWVFENNLLIFLSESHLYILEPGNNPVMMEDAISQFLVLQGE